MLYIIIPSKRKNAQNLTPMWFKYPSYLQSIRTVRDSIQDSLIDITVNEVEPSDMLTKD